MAIQFGVSHIDVNGLSFEPPLPGITVVIGPNNSGKSYLLRRIMHATSGVMPPAEAPPTLKVTASEGEVEEWFLLNSRPSPEAEPGIRRFNYTNGSQDRLTFAQFYQQWATHAVNPGVNVAIAPLLTCILNAESRLQTLNEVGPRDLNLPATEPLHVLYDDTEFEANLSDRVERAFGFPVSVMRFPAGNIALLKGAPVAEQSFPPDPALLEQMMSRPRLNVNNSGDGVRSFTGLILHAGSKRRPLLIVDEPEAFLHPPQAQQLGEALVAMTSEDSQVFVATHSTDMLGGLLNAAQSAGKALEILRLSETHQGERVARILPKDRVSEMWADPIYRSVRAFESLFYTATVVCEGDSDQLVYSAVMNSLYGMEPSSTRWIHVGGKARVGRMVRALRDLGLRAACIFDLDFLRDKDQLESTLRILGYEAEIEAALATADELATDLAPHAAVPTIGAIRGKLAGFSTATAGTPLTSAEIGDLQAFLKPDGGWRQLKRHGLDALDQSRANVADLLDRLRTLGIYVLPVGELESWYPNLRPKQGFAARVLEACAHETPPDSLREFLTSLHEWLTPVE